MIHLSPKYLPYVELKLNANRLGAAKALSEVTGLDISQAYAILKVRGYGFHLFTPAC